jgi:hypothetical protein
MASPNESARTSDVSSASGIIVERERREATRPADTSPPDASVFRPSFELQSWTALKRLLRAPDEPVPELVDDCGGCGRCIRCDVDPD